MDSSVNVKRARLNEYTKNWRTNREKELSQMREEYLSLVPRLNKNKPLYEKLRLSFPRILNEDNIIKNGKYNNEQERDADRLRIRRNVLLKHRADLYKWAKEHIQELRTTVFHQELCQDIIDLEIDFFFPD